jgi:hypothetical protein
MEDVIRITILSETGSNVHTTGKERLTVTPDGIRYDFEPLVQSEKNPRKQWEVSASGAEYARLYGELSKSVESVMRSSASSSFLGREADLITFILYRGDGTRARYTCRLPDTEYMECFSVVDRMVKSCGGPD